MSVTMIKSRPLSPPISNNGELYQHNLQHLLQHNTNNSSFSGDQYEYDERTRSESRATLSYTSSPNQHPESRYSHQRPTYTYRSAQGHPMRRKPYRDGHPVQDSGYGNSPNEHQMYQHPYDTPAESPPTPGVPAEGILTRSGMAIARALPVMKPLPVDKSRQVKSPRIKKVRKDKDKAEKKIISKLEKPLSELCKDWTHIAVTDIETYVNRSAEERRREVEDAKTPGKVKRPMNSFMLYRKAYQHVTKEFYLHNNHQFVSQVCGDSWKLETDAIIGQYKQWAAIERSNHANAHPGYKFTPSKAGGSKASSKRKPTDELATDDDASDLEDFDWTGSNSARRSNKRPRQVHSQEKQPVYQTNNMPYTYSRNASVEPSHSTHNRSSYQMTNPGKPLPAQCSQDELHNGQYYQQTVHQNTNAPGVEDVVIRKTAAPGMHYLGLPRGHEFDIMQQSYGAYDGTPAPETRIDPSLLIDDNAVFEDPYAAQMNQYLGHEEYQHAEHIFSDSYGNLGQEYPDTSFDNLDAHQTLDINTLQLQDQHAHLLKGGQDAWQIDQSLDAGQEFDNWYEQSEQ